MAGDHSALSKAAQRGLALFRGKAGCNGCHISPNFTDEQFHYDGVAWRTGGLTDEGRARVTGAAFKTPTLREVTRTAPYMHDGSFARITSRLSRNKISWYFWGRWPVALQMAGDGVQGRP